MRTLKNFIDGAWVGSHSARVLPVVDPGNGEVLCNVPAGCAADIEHAAEKAAAAQGTWRNVPAEQRIQYLFRMK
ncbi:partial Malonate-semialdehyde dehydrogenase, partial [uncultured bacterium]